MALPVDAMAATIEKDNQSTYDEYSQSSDLRPNLGCVQNQVGAKVDRAVTCVQYRVGSPGWIRKKNTDIEEHEIQYRSTNASISYTDIEGTFVDIDKSSISVYNDIRVEVLNFDNDVSSIT
jgi:hypothetical protein